MSAGFWSYQGILSKSARPRSTGARQTPAPLLINYRNFNGLCPWAAWRHRKERTSYILSEQEIYRLWNEVLAPWEDLFGSCLGHSEVFTNYARSPGQAPCANGPSKVPFLEVFLFPGGQLFGSFCYQSLTNHMSRKGPSRDKHWQTTSPNMHYPMLNPLEQIFQMKRFCLPPKKRKCQKKLNGHCILMEPWMETETA